MNSAVETKVASLVSEYGLREVLRALCVTAKGLAMPRAFRILNKAYEAIK